MANSSNIETDAALPDTQSKDPEGLVKSKQRVADHGEVFTPSWMVEDMLNLVKTESERIDSRFLEPACGSGNFLKSVLKRKLTTVQSRYGKSDFERRHHALFALMPPIGPKIAVTQPTNCSTWVAPNTPIGRTNSLFSVIGFPQLVELGGGGGGSCCPCGGYQRPSDANHQPGAG